MHSWPLQGKSEEYQVLVHPYTSLQPDIHVHVGGANLTNDGELMQ